MLMLLVEVAAVAQHQVDLEQVAMVVLAAPARQAHAAALTPPAVAARPTAWRQITESGSGRAHHAASQCARTPGMGRGGAARQFGVRGPLRRDTVRTPPNS